jgi:hypothetical protein
LKGTKSTLLGTADDVPFRVLSPVGQVIQSTTPTFRWKPIAGANSYEVTVTDDQLNEVASSKPLTVTEWRLPFSLKRGRVYSWQVTATKDGKKISAPVSPAPQAKFKILDASHNKELERAKEALANYHLGLGVLYVRVGLLDEAEREFLTQLKLTPGSDITQKFLESVRSAKH